MLSSVVIVRFVNMVEMVDVLWLFGMMLVVMMVFMLKKVLWVSDVMMCVVISIL